MGNNNGGAQSFGEHGPSAGQNHGAWTDQGAQDQQDDSWENTNQNFQDANGDDHQESDWATGNNNDQNDTDWQNNDNNQALGDPQDASQDWGKDQGGWSGDQNQNTTNYAFGGSQQRILLGPLGAWYSLSHDPASDAERESPYDVPEVVAARRESKFQVRPGKGYLYSQSINRPCYLDSIERPYAVFSFRYLDKGRWPRREGRSQLVTA